MDVGVAVDCAHRPLQGTKACAVTLRTIKKTCRGRQVKQRDAGLES